MKHYQIPAEQFIGWIRIARPGSILGPQQFYLGQKENEYLRFDISSANHHATNNYKKSISMKVDDMSPIDRLKSVKGEASQGNYLVNAKERHSEKKQQRATYSNSKVRSNYAASSSKAERTVVNF